MDTELTASVILYDRGVQTAELRPLNGGGIGSLATVVDKLNKKSNGNDTEVIKKGLMYIQSKMAPGMMLTEVDFNEVKEKIAELLKV